MNDNTFKVEIVTSDNYNKIIIEMIWKMALETENKTLDYNILNKSVPAIVFSPTFGFYQVSIQGQTCCGMNLITYEFDVVSGKRNMWLQSVFVEKEFRSKGVFRGLVENLCKILRQQNGSFYENNLKLYVDNYNENAKQVYYKLGFKGIVGNFYELDFYFDSYNKDLSNSYLTGDLALELCNKETFKLLVDSAKNISFLDITKSLDLTTASKLGVEEMKNIEYVIDTPKTAEIAIIRNAKSGKIISVIYIFIEYSDWRNSLFWFVSSFKVNVSFLDSILSQKIEIVQNLIGLALRANTCGLRVIANPSVDSFWKEVGIPLSHYQILEKKVERE